MTTTQLIRALSTLSLLTGIWCIAMGFALTDHNNPAGGFYFIGGSILFGFSLLSLALTSTRN